MRLTQHLQALGDTWRNKNGGCFWALKLDVRFRWSLGCHFTGSSWYFEGWCVQNVCLVDFTVVRVLLSLLAHFVLVV